MNPKVQFASYALWIAHPVLQTLVGGAMYWRKQHRKFPVFFAYIVFQIATFPILFYVQLRMSYATDFYVYWSFFAVSLALGFKVIHEIFLDVFRPYHTLKDLGTVLFTWAALVMMLVAGVVAAASPGAGQDPLVQALMTVERCVRVIQCGLILFLILFSRYLGVSRKQRSFGIALGFGSFAALELIVFALRAANYISESNMNLANMSAYNCGIAVWLGYMLAATVAREAPSNLLTSQRWEQSLADLQRPQGSDSLIPMFEGMVDRAFSRTRGESSASHDEPPAEPVGSRKDDR